MKKIKQYPFETKKDIIIAYYLMAEHSGRYLLLMKEILKDMESQLVQEIKLNILSKMIKRNSIIEGDFKKYLLELEKEENRILIIESSNSLKIKFEVFKSYEERLAINESVLLNDFGDLSDAVSYYKLRKIHNKCKTKLGLPELTDFNKIEGLLKECNINRNYTHHFTEPKLLTWRQFREQQLQNYPGYIWPPEDIEITRASYMNVLTVLRTFDLYTHKWEMFNILQFCLRNDYSILNGTKVAKLKLKEVDCIEDSSALEISKLGTDLFWL